MRNWILVTFQLRLAGQANSKRPDQNPALMGGLCHSQPWGLGQQQWAASTVRGGKYYSVYVFTILCIVRYQGLVRFSIEARYSVTD